MTLVLRDVGVPDSPLARWDPRWKLAAVLLSSFGLAAVLSPAAAAVGWLAAVALAFLGRVPMRAVRDRTGLVALAVLPVVLVVPLGAEPGEPAWTLGPVQVSQPGLLAAVAVAFRALAIGTLGLILVRTAPLPQTLAAAHALYIPGVLVQIAQLAYRYAFLLAAEARRMQVALRTRGFRPRTNAHSYHTLGHAVGGLLVRGGDRAEAVSAAMRCRGFDGTFRPLAAFQTRPADVAGFLAVVLGAAVLVAVDRFG